jgi:hypothetical protein
MPQKLSLEQSNSLASQGITEFLLVAEALVEQQAETGEPLVQVREREREQELERLEPKVILAEQLALVQEPQASHQQRLGQVEGQVVEQVVEQAVGLAERLVLAVPQTASSWHQHLPELFWLVCQFVRLAEQLPSASLPSLWHVYLQRLEQAQEHQLRYQETHQSYLSL